MAAKVEEQSISDKEVIPISRKPSNKELQTKANDTHSVLNEKSQGYKTTAAGYAVDSNGNGYIIVASSDKHLTPDQRNSLDPGKGEVRASGAKRHAEVTILDYCKKNNLKLVSVAASRPVCGNCAKELDEANVQVISKRKKTCNS